jgi:hypothetical protein
MANNLMTDFKEWQFPDLMTYTKDVITPEGAFSEEESSERAEQRSILRQGIQSIMSRYKGNEDPAWDSEQGQIDLEKIKKYKKALSGDLEITYDELTWDKPFIRDARAMYKAEFGFDFRESDARLKDYVFSRFNSVEQNIGMTAGNLVFDNMFYQDFDNDELQATANAYKTFSEVDWTGKGSRDFGSQAIDFFGNTIKDPAMYGTGYTAGWLAKGARLLGRKAFSKQISDNIAGLIGISAYTGTLGGTQSANIQNVQQDLGVRDDISVGQIATSTALAAALPVGIRSIGKGGVLLSDYTQAEFGHTIPILRRNIASWMRNVQSTIPRPFFSGYGRGVTTLEKEGGTIKGKEAAMIGVIKDIEAKIIAGHSTRTAGSDFYKALTDDVINPMNEKIQRGYQNLTYNSIDKEGYKRIGEAVKKLLDENKTNPSFAIQGKLKELYDLIVPTKQIAKNKQKIKDYDAAMVKYKQEFQEATELQARLNKEALEKDFDWATNTRPEAPQVKFPVKPKPHNIKDPVEEALLKAESVDDVFRQIRTTIYGQEQGAYGQGDFITSQAYKELYKIFKVEQRNFLNSKGDKLAWDALQTATGDFKNALHNLPIGKEFEKILHFHKLANTARSTGATGNATAFDLQAQEEAGNLLNYIINNKNSLIHLKQFESVLQNIDNRTTHVMNARSAGQTAALQKEMEIAYTKKDFEKFPDLQKIDTLELDGQLRSNFIKDYAKEFALNSNRAMESYPALLEIIKSSLGRKLETEGVESIAKILNKDDGFELIGYMFPNMKKDLSNIEKLGQYLDKHVAPKHSQSVIVNMTVARAAQDIGAATIGEKGSGSFVLTAFYGMQRWRNLINNKNFQKAMVDAINNNGRLPTRTQFRLERQLGFDAEAIRNFQDDIANAMLITRPIIKNRENLQRKVNRAKRMLQ